MQHSPAGTPVLAVSILTYWPLLSTLSTEKENQQQELLCKVRTEVGKWARKGRRLSKVRTKGRRLSKVKKERKTLATGVFVQSQNKKRNKHQQLLS